MGRSEGLQQLVERTSETVRSAALGAAPDGIRTFVIPAAARDAVRGALEEDGLAVAFASDATTLVGRATDTLALGGDGPMALARAARNALASGAVSVLFLDEAGAADPVTARFWWTLAVLLSEENAPDGVLIAAVKPRVRAPWTEASEAVRGLVPVRELATVTASEAVRPKSRLSRHGSTRARRALLRAAAALLRGSPRALDAAVQDAIAASEQSDDPREGAAGALAVALRGFPEDRGEPLCRALALARLANDHALTAAAEAAAGASAWLRGDLADARERLVRAPLERLPRSIARIFSDLGVSVFRADRTIDAGEMDLAPDSATLATRGDAHERAGRRAVAARFFACAAAAQGQPFRGATWERARRHWETADPRLAAALSAAASPGLGSTTLPPGAAGIAEALRAAATLSAAASAGKALELACQLVPCRSALLLSPDGRALAARGAAALALGRLHADGGERGSAPNELSSGNALRVVLARSHDDPPFSRDERRLAAAALDLATTVLAPTAKRATTTASGPAPREPEKRPRPARLQALDDRLSIVERDAIVDALRKNGGNLSRTARTLGLSRNGLKMKLARHGLPRGTAA